MTAWRTSNLGEEPSIQYGTKVGQNRTEANQKYVVSALKSRSVGDGKNEMMVF